MGHKDESAEAGGTVKIGRRDVPDMGGDVVTNLALSATEIETGSPEMIGGGSSSPSDAFRESCLAKSDACHHSRNFSANIDVGRRILKEESKLGTAMRVNVRGLKMLFVWPGLSACVGFGCVASAIALWSASPNLRILVPIIHKNGEWYFEPSKR